MGRRQRRVRGVAHAFGVFDQRHHQRGGQQGGGRPRRSNGGDAGAPPELGNGKRKRQTWKSADGGTNGRRTHDRRRVGGTVREVGDEGVALDAAGAVIGFVVDLGKRGRGDVCVSKACCIESR